jgi:hypothetical protein
MKYPLSRHSIMKKLPYLRSLSALALGLILAGAALAQSVSAKKTLVVNGHIADAAVVQIDGHSYADVDALVRMMNATVRFESGRVILTLPAAGADAKPGRATPGLSKDFAKAGISQVAAMQEWKGAIASAIRFGLAAGTWLAPWLQDYRVRAEGSLSQTSLAVKTADDRKALDLLKNEFTSLGEWDSNTQATIHSLDAEQALDPAIAQNDPLRTKISECGTFLSAMLVAGEFADNPNCH